MKFQGDISSIPITDVAQNLSSNRKAGTLSLRRGEEVRRIAFRDGKIVSYADNLGFSIPRWLEEKGLVDPGVLRKAVAKARRSRRKDLGEFLQGARAMRAEECRSHLKSLLQEMLYETFTFREGTFEFAENEFDPEAMDPEITGAGLELAVGPILIEAARRLDDWEAIRRWVPSEDDIYRVAPGEKKACAAELGEDETARAVVELLDGTLTIREVVARLATSRFEAYRAIAGLVTRKWARPIDGAEILEQLGGLRSGREKERAYAQLKAALEREPGNRVLLKKVAELSLHLGKKEESAILQKLLAPALLEDGDVEGAERALRQSLKLNPKDIGVWLKLYDLLSQKGEEDSLYSFGTEMARHLRKMGVEELARDHLKRLTERFPTRVDLRLDLAEVHFALGDKAKAVEGLLELVRELLKKARMDDAERVLSKVIEYDRGHKRAREIYEKIRNGKLARQRAKRRLILRGSLAALVLAGLGAFLGYDLFARREFVLTTRQVFAEGLLEKGDYKKAVQRLEDVSRRHRFSLLRFFEGKEVLEALKEAERHQEEAASKKVTPLSKAAVPAPPSPPPPGAARKKN